MSALSDLHPSVEVFPYDRDLVEVDTVVFGFGRLSKGLVVAGHDLAMRENFDQARASGVAVVTFMHPCEDLVAQDCLYSHHTLNGRGMKTRVVGAIKEAYFAPEQESQVLEALSRESTRFLKIVVSLPGYHLNERRELDLKNPEIQNDILTLRARRLIENRPEAANELHPESEDLSVSVLGFSPTKCTNRSLAERPLRTPTAFIVEGLGRRRDTHTEPLTVLSFENARHNGGMVRRSVLGFAQMVDGSLYNWIKDKNDYFPDTVIDRIVPGMGPAEMERAWRSLGARDQHAIFSEKFGIQFIQDRDHLERAFFPRGTPGWASIDGVILTPHTSPAVDTKIRLVNGLHVALGWLGSRTGCHYSYEVLHLPGMSSLLRDMLHEEIAPHVDPFPSREIGNTIESILTDRFNNPELPDPVTRLNNDAVRKFRERVIPSINDCIAQGRAFPGLSLAVASWLVTHCSREWIPVKRESGEGAQLQYFDEDHSPIPTPVENSEAAYFPSLERLSDPYEMLRCRDLFGDFLPVNEQFIGSVERAIDFLLEHKLKEPGVTKYLEMCRNGLPEDN